MEKIELREANLSVLNDDEIEITLDLNQSKRFSNEERFDYETIDAELFIQSLDNAPLILNHRQEKIISDDMELKAEDGKVIIKAKLDPRNPYASYVLSLREKSQNRLGCSFGFIALADSIKNRFRTVTKLAIKEISVLTNVSPAYHSSVRSLENNITLEDLKNIIDESVKNAIFEQQKAQEQPKEEPKEEEKLVEEPKIEEKPVVEQVFKLDTTGLESTLKTFLDEFKDVVKPVEQPKKEEKQEEIVEKVEEKPVVDEEKVKSDIEKYKKMLEEL